MFFPALKNDFTNWDDDIYLFKNPLIFDKSLSGVLAIFDFRNALWSQSVYTPLTILSYNLEHTFFGFNPFNYHLNSLGLHLVNTLLVFWFLYLIVGQRGLAFISAIIFGMHPMHAEAVCWVAARKELLGALFYLLSLIFYVKFARESKIQFYIFSLLFFILALLSKLTAMSLFLNLFLIDFLGNRNSTHKRFFGKIPFLLAIGVVFYFNYAHAVTPHVQECWRGVHFIDKAIRAIYGLSFYIVKLLIPLSQSALYAYNAKASLISSVLVITLFVLFVCYFRHVQAVLMGALFFIAALLPILGIHFVGPIVSDRYAYIPSIGFFLMIGGCFWHWVKAQGVFLKRIRPIMFLFLIGSVFFLFHASRQACASWNHSISLWENVIRHYPEIPEAQLNLANAYEEKRHFDKAFECYNKIISLNPKMAPAFHGRGVIYSLKGDYSQALRDFDKVIELDVENSAAYFTKALLYLLVQNKEESLACMNKAIQYDPFFVSAYFGRAKIYDDKGRRREALEDCRKALMLLKGGDDIRFGKNSLRQREALRKQLLQFEENLKKSL